ncbi:MAG: hypothetical protein Q4C50_03270 [Eubacteriales bacterium]|nr:hypothetical protein [Eubacteriales bacterium]
MAGNISVDSRAVESGIRCCKTSIQELENAVKKLVRNYQRAGANGWRDQKYVALGSMVQECGKAMMRPTGELQECLEKLEELLKAVRKYEEANL